ncbi:MAG: hypothetical protein Q8861_08145 [Bacteroidota bacterium]|nr:hypothetical protein [Bacteroidota bacterium]
MNTKKTFHFSWSLTTILVIYCLAVLSRLRLNFSSALPPSVDGIYYPLQVRHLLGNGLLAFPDMPFAFWIEAFFAKIISFFTASPQDEVILFTCRIIDSVVPPLLIFPVYWLHRQISPSRPNLLFLSIVCFFALFNPSLNVLLVCDFHKNAIGIALLFFFLYWALQFLKNRNTKTFAFALSGILLVGLTHIGCFSVLALFIPILIAVYSTEIKQKIQKTFSAHQLKKLILLSIGVSLLLIILIFMGDTGRLYKLLNVTTGQRLFENSLIYQLINNKLELRGIRLIYFVFNLSCSIFGVILFFIIRKKISIDLRRFLGAIVIWQVLLMSPFIGMEWAERIYFIAFVPFTVMLIFAFSYLKSAGKIILSSVIGIFILLAIGTAPTRKNPVITPGECHELASMQSSIRHSNNSIVVAKHGLEWWVAWVCHCKVSSSNNIRKTKPELRTIYYLKAKKTEGRPNSGIPEIEIPEKSAKIAETQNFELFVTESVQ